MGTQKNTIARLQDLSALLARIMAVIAIFFLISFPSIAKIVLPVAVIFSLLSGNWQKKYQLLKKNYVIIFAVILVLFFAIGTLYSKAPLHQITTGFFKYTKILYLLFLLPLFAEQKWRNIATNTLIVSVLLDIVVSFLVLYGVTDICQQFHFCGYTGEGSSAIFTTAILGFVNFVLINRAIDIKRYRWLYLVLFGIGFYALFFLYIERTGQAVFFGLVALTLWQRFNWRGIVAGVIMLPLLLGALLVFSPNFHKRFAEGANDISTYSKTDQHKHGTSLGLRLAFVQHSFKAIQAHPIFGNGTGSFKLVYTATGGPHVGYNPILQDPHNEYAMITVQLGYVGLLCFLLWLTTQWIETKKLPLPEKRLAQGIILNLVIVSLCYSALFLSIGGLFYITFFSLYFPAPYYS